MLSKVLNGFGLDLLKPHTAEAVWQMNLGAQIVEGGVYFRVWAPNCHSVEAVLETQDRVEPLQAQDEGYFSAMISGVKEGTLYKFRLDGKNEYPDPCSRFQPEGPHGPSMVVNPNRFKWKDNKWRGVEMKGQVIYELHIGTFTQEGTFDAAIAELPELKRLGITVLEIMPVAEWAGRWNWGYDGVDLFAPTHRYGDHEAFKRFVNAAHENCLGVILDVVYNHLGPDGNFLGIYSKDYFTNKYKNEWGKSINFDGPNSKAVREFIIQNACYWISEFHLDGLRLDATQNIRDEGVLHVLGELSQRTREAAGDRKIVLIGENEPQKVTCINPVNEQGYGLDGLWNDDFHHSARVAMTGFTEAYYTDYRGRPQELISAIKQGFLYQGQYYSWQKKGRGSAVNSSHSAPSFILYIQNHDQIANSLDGRRMHDITSPGILRAITTLMLLAPETPMLFMGQEFAATTPFLYFADHKEELIEPIRKGRLEFLSQFPSYAKPEAQKKTPDPFDQRTFERSKLDFSDRKKNKEIYRLHEDLLAIRREDSVIAQQDRFKIEGSVLGEKTFLLRYFGEVKGDDRLLIVNLGNEYVYDPCPEPLLAPPCDRVWKLTWSSDDKRYGGPGKPSSFSTKNWKIPAEATLFFTAVPEKS